MFVVCQFGSAKTTTVLQSISRLSPARVFRRSLPLTESLEQARGKLVRHILAVLRKFVLRTFSFTHLPNYIPTFALTKGQRSKRWPIYIFNLVDVTKLPCYPPPTQHHSFFRNFHPNSYIPTSSVILSYRNSTVYHKKSIQIN